MYLFPTVHPIKGTALAVLYRITLIRSAQVYSSQSIIASVCRYFIHAFPTHDPKKYISVLSGFETAQDVQTSRANAMFGA